MLTTTWTVRNKWLCLLLMCVSYILLYTANMHVASFKLSFIHKPKPSPEEILYAEIFSTDRKKQYLRLLLNSTIGNQSSLIDVNIHSPLLKLIHTNTGKRPYALYCSTGYKPVGIGNALAIYWTARATAFFMNYSFIMNNHINNQTTWINTTCNRPEFTIFDSRPLNQSDTWDAIHRHMQWTWFLPMEYHQTFFNSDTFHSGIHVEPHAIANTYNYLWQQHNNKWHRYAAPYTNELIFMTYNPWFIPVIRNNTRDAFKQYYHHTANDMFYKNIVDAVATYNVIVIHLRLGDTLIKDNPHRNVMNMKYYTCAFEMIYVQLDAAKDCKLYVISQLARENAHHDADVLALNMSRRVTRYMVNEFEMYLNDKWNKYVRELVVIGNDTTDNDYFRMATAQYLICSASSFCLEAAMANYLDTKLIILPSEGPWGKVAKMLVQMTTKNEFIKVKHHVVINSAKYSQRTGKFHKFQNESDMLTFENWFAK
eukprot:59360_1